MNGVDGDDIGRGRGVSSLLMAAPNEIRPFVFTWKSAHAVLQDYTTVQWSQDHGNQSNNQPNRVILVAERYFCYYVMLSDSSIGATVLGGRYRKLTWTVKV